MNEAMIAYCGLNCSTCQIYLASIEEDIIHKTSKKERISKGITKSLSAIFQAKDTPVCNGCKTENGRLCYSCKSCKIRECAKAKEINSCADCTEYACKKLDDFFKHNPSAKNNLAKVFNP